MDTLSAPAGRWLRASLLLAASLLATLPGRAQVVNTLSFTVPGTGPRGPFAQLLPTAGGWLTPGNIRFRNDSTVGSLLRLSPDLQITRSRQFSVARRSSILNYGPFVAMPGGLVGRAQAPTGLANYVLSFDSTFAQRWGVLLQPNIEFQALASHGRRRVVGYGSALGGGFTRVWGNALTGTNWRGRRITSSTTGWYISTCLAPDSSGVHYLTGQQGVPLIKLDTTKVYWGRLLSTSGMLSTLATPGQAANGDLWLPLMNIPVAGQPSEAIVCRFDTAGTLLQSWNLRLPGRFLGAMEVRALPTGEVLITGFARNGGGGKFEPMLFKLTAAGALIWAHRWNAGTGGQLVSLPTLVALPGGGFRFFGTDLLFVDLDANFNGCQFVDETANVTVGPATVISTPLALTMTPLAVTATAAPPLFNRSFAYTRTLLCTAVGLAAETPADATALTAWPQPLPRGAALHLALPTTWLATETHLTLLSALGQVVWRGTAAQAEAAPPTLPPGVWLLRATGPRGATRHQRLLTE